MQLKMKLYVAMAAAYFIPCFSITVEAETVNYIECLKHDWGDCMAEAFNLDGLNQTAIQIVCSAKPQLAPCKFFSDLKSHSEHYLAVLKSHLHLSINLGDYISEERSYIKDVCVRDEIAPYMIYACESLNALEKEALYDTESDTYHDAEDNYKKIMRLTMEMACDLSEGPEAFCNRLNEIKDISQELSKAKNDLKTIVTEVNEQIDLICKETITYQHYFWGHPISCPDQ